MDPEIEVPDSMYFVTTRCMICGEQFYVTTLKAHWPGEYTCPDCKTLKLSTTTGPATFETDTPPQ